MFSYNISTDYLQNLTWNWDNTPYLIYDPSLVLFYNFDNRSALGENDTHVADLSMYGNNGTVVGGSNISWTSNGKYGGAFNFSGNTNYIQVGNLEIQNSSQGFTISAWINFPDTNNNNEILVKGYNSSLGIVSYRFDVNFAEKLYASYYNGAWISYFTSNTIKVNNWTYVVFSYNLTSVNLYINNIKESFSCNNWTNNLTSMMTNVGYYSISSWNMNGSIDNLMVLNRSLSDNEITQIYKSQLTKYNLQNWTFQTNQAIDGEGMNYNLCSSNSTKEICSSSKNIRGLNNIVVNFTTSKGTVRNDFYATNTHGSYINTNDVNYLFLRQRLLEVGLNVINIDLGEQRWINNSDGTFTNTTSYPYYAKEQIIWARSNGLKVMLLGGQTMPTFEQNRTSDCSINNYSCGPINYTRYSDLQLTIISNLTNNGEYLDSIIGFSPYNEPHSQLLKNLNSVGENQYKRMQIYYNIYNNSRTRIKLTYPNLAIGGPSGHFGWGTDTVAYMHWDWWFANFTNQMDFVDTHIYTDDFSMSSRFNEKLNNEFYGNCTLYGGNCSKIYVTEFNVYSDSVKNANTNFYGSQIGDFYQNILNQLQNNISVVLYQYTSDKWGMINKTDNSTKQSYDVTKNFAHLCPGGSAVYQSSSDDDTIKTVTCKDGNKYNIIVINTDTVSKNVSLSQIPLGVTSFTNYESGGGYLVTNQVSELGIMDSYDIKYLTFDSTIIPTITPYCNSFINALGRMGTWFALIILALVVIVVLGFVQQQPVDLKVYILGGVITLVTGAVFLVLGILIIDTIC